MPLIVHRRNLLRLAASAAGSAAATVTLVGAALPLASRPATAEQNSVTELIQRTAAQVLDLVMTKTGAAREAGIVRVLETYFDLNYMARSSLGTHWNRATPEQRERFLKAAASAEAHAYARRFGQYGGQTLTVDRAAPVTRGDGVSIGKQQAQPDRRRAHRDPVGGAHGRTRGAHRRRPDRGRQHGRDPARGVQFLHPGSRRPGRTADQRARGPCLAVINTVRNCSASISTTRHRAL